MYKKIKQTSSLKKRSAVALSALIVIAFIGSAAWMACQHFKSKPTATSATTASPEAQMETAFGLQQTNNKGATVTPITTDTNNKDASSGDAISLQAAGGASTTTGMITPIITYAGYENNTQRRVEVDAFIPGVSETGVCTLTLESGSHNVVRTSPAKYNVTTTSCDNFLVDRSVFPVNGNWSATVSYASASKNGVSKPTTFIIE